MDTPLVFDFLEKCGRAKKRAALVTLVDAQGATMRRRGCHMAVCEDGSFVGSLSAGCVESAIVAEAGEAIASGQPRLVRYGKGSPYIDIRLPCGGGMDLHFQPLQSGTLVKQAIGAITDRKPFQLALPKGAKTAKILPESIAGKGPECGDYFYIQNVPTPRLIVLGQGAVAYQMARTAAASLLEVQLLSSDSFVIDKAQGEGMNAALLQSVGDGHLIQSDPWSAIVFLFHDHDWEGELLRYSLQQPRFYLGAMGGSATRAARIAMLKDAGVGDDQIAQIRAPIGLVPSARDPSTLAVSAIAEILQVYQALVERVSENCGA